MSSIGGVFESNCTVPDTPYHYVSGPNSRGTIDILMSSLTAVIISTWTVQHLNLPLPRPLKTRRQRFFAFFRDGFRKIFWMILMLMAPELMVGVALVSWVSARNSEKEMKSFAKDDNVEWTIVHGFFANMGGFVVRFTTDTLPPTQTPSSDLPPAESQIVTDMKSEVHISMNETQDNPAKDEQFNLWWRLKGIDPSTSTGQSNWDKWVGHNETFPNDGCPCAPAPTEQYRYMTIQDIASHANVFWNGRFYMSPRRFRKSLHSRIDEERQQTPSPNHASASQALYDFSKNTEIGFREINRVGVSLASLQSDVWTLDAKQTQVARSLGIISILPKITEEELNDQSKGDFAVKIVAVFQVISIVVQLIVRKTQNLASSQLEVMAVAFASSALLIYTFSFQKPQDVYVPHYVVAHRYPTSEEIQKIALAGPFLFLPAIAGHSPVPNLSLHYCGEWWFSPGKTMQLAIGAPIQIFIWGSIIASTLFGLIHLIAYTFHFPTPIEKLLWEISSILTVVLPVFLLFQSMSNIRLMRKVLGKCAAKLGSAILPEGVRERFKKQVDSWIARMTVTFQQSLSLGQVPLLLAAVGWFVYIMCRLFLVVESFRSLFFLAPGAFKSIEWSDVIPHFG